MGLIWIYFTLKYPNIARYLEVPYLGDWDIKAEILSASIDIFKQQHR